MNSKQRYNLNNERNYFFAPFTEQRRILREVWSQTSLDWNNFLFDAEQFNTRYKFQNPGKGNANIELIIKSVLK